MHYLKYIFAAFVIFFSCEKSLSCADRLNIPAAISLNIPPVIMSHFEKAFPMIAAQSGLPIESLREKHCALWACIAQDFLGAGLTARELLDAFVYSIFKKTCMIACKDIATLEGIVATTSFRPPVCVCIYFDFEAERDENLILSVQAEGRTFILPAAVKYVV